MIRRRLTLKRVDPWSVLKFGFVVNVALMLVGMLGFWILWIVVGRLGLVDQFCDSVGSIVLDLQECSLNGGNIFRTLLFLGLLGVVVQTGIMVFGAFLYNLISDLTGGLGFTFLDESGEASVTTARRPAEATSTTGSTSTSSSSSPTGSVGAGASGGGQPQRGDTGSGSPTSSPSGAGAPRSAAGPGGPPDQSSTPRRPTPDGPPPAPGRPDPGGTGAPERPRPGTSGTTGGSLWNDPTRSTDRT